MKAFGIVCLVFIGMLVFWAASEVGWFGGRALEVVKEQVDPAALLKKYEWFKNASAELDAKLANIAVYESRFRAFGSKDGTCPSTINRTALEQCMIWQQEVSGIKASYNDLAAEYNAQMAKINYRFTNVGDLPRGASGPVPREYRSYVIY